MRILVVVDVQNDFVTGALANPEAQKVMPNIIEKVKEYQADPNGYIIYTKDTHGKEYPDTRENRYLPILHCIDGTEGQEICEGAIDYNHSRQLIEPKSTFAASYWDDIIGEAVWDMDDETIESIESIEIIGFCTDICVISNALAIVSVVRDPSCDIFVDASCCAGLTPEKHKAALEVMKSCQIEVINE